MRKLVALLALCAFSTAFAGAGDKNKKAATQDPAAATEVAKEKQGVIKQKKATEEVDAENHDDHEMEATEGN